MSAYAQRPDATPEQTQLSLDLFGDLQRRAQSSLLAKGIADIVRTEGGATLVGQTVQAPADLATLAQILRDPGWETFRWFWMKGDTIVGHDAFSCRLPGAATTGLGGFGETIAWASRRMQDLGADSYRVLQIL